MSRLMDLLLKLGKVDRRVIFLIIAIVVLIPLLNPIGLTVEPTSTTIKVFEAIEAIPEGGRIMVSFDYDPASKPEMHPIAVSILYHAFKKNLKVYIPCLWPGGPFMANDALKLAGAEEMGKVYGEDYVLLGFRPGNEAVVKGIASNIRYLYTVDANNTLIDDIPMMDGIRNLLDFDFLFAVSAGWPGAIEWVQYGSDPTGIPMSAGNTSIQVNEVIPYVNTGQMIGLIAGMPGAAEYETLLDRKGMGRAGMDAQSVAHIVIILFIVFGNFTYYIERQRARKKY
ncbi:MAG: hypothetical protein QF551_03665 [Candidatus Marinimicrobia bacterium]|nr:hypothetical protein [Candidatus Neomarinimicrobiota bacterium]MDP6836728.1 hypothetical protein [Candidatus Neomarinimicrobiota bacterium]MDP6966351.1 hypothetical protein [Candidatus Neomarinimicrobiota bacterium]